MDVSADLRAAFAAFRKDAWCQLQQYMATGSDHAAAGCGCGLWFADPVKEGKLDPDLGRSLAGRLLAWPPGVPA